jgi:hypothetical protein
MARRKAVAASIASTIIFSSLIVSNFVVYSGAAVDFRLVSLATEERAYGAQSSLIAGISMLDLIDGAQELLASGHFECSNAASSVAQTLGSEVVRLDGGGLQSNATLSVAPDIDAVDDFAALRPFNGSVMGLTDLEAVALVQGSSPDGSVRYFDSVHHLLNLPLRLGAVTGHCLDAEVEFSAAVGSLGSQMCNSTALAEVAPQVLISAVDSAAADGVSLSISYFVTSTQPCTLRYWITAQQPAVMGPEGPFAFTEEESGYLEA